VREVRCDVSGQPSILGTLVGVHTTEARRERIPFPCPRCGIRRKVKRDPRRLCDDCRLVVATLGEAYRWQPDSGGRMP
jgi:hypothetical protein